MRKWFTSWCSECGRDDGWWEDVVEGPETPEAYEARIKQQEFWTAVFGPIIEKQIATTSEFLSKARELQEKKDSGEYITFPIRKTRD